MVFSWKMSPWEACSGRIWPSFKHFSGICHLPSENLKKSRFGLDTQFSSIFMFMTSFWLVPTKSREHKLFKYVWYLLGSIQEMATMSLRTLGKVRKLEMLTKLGGVKIFKLLDFQKSIKICKTWSAPFHEHCKFKVRFQSNSTLPRVFANRKI